MIPVRALAEWPHTAYFAAGIRKCCSLPGRPSAHQLHLNTPISTSKQQLNDVTLTFVGDGGANETRVAPAAGRATGAYWDRRDSSKAAPRLQSASTTTIPLPLHAPLTLPPSDAPDVLGDDDCRLYATYVVAVCEVGQHAVMSVRSKSPVRTLL